MATSTIGSTASAHLFLSGLDKCELSKEANELFEEIKSGGSFIKITETAPNVFKEKITTVFRQILCLDSEVEFIKAIKEVSKGHPPIVIYPGSYSNTFIGVEMINMTLEHMNFIVEDPLNKDETRVEASCDIFVFICLYHELVHVLQNALENSGKIECISNGSYVFDKPSFDTKHEAMAILGIKESKYCENHIRELLGLAKRINHRATETPPFSEESAKTMDTKTKIKNLKNYIREGASFDSTQMMKHLSHDEIDRFAILDWAVICKRKFVFSAILEAKEKWQPIELKFALSLANIDKQEDIVELIRKITNMELM